MSRNRLVLATCAASVVMVCHSAPVAFAHEGASAQRSFEEGFLHPLMGVDHLAAMVAVGLLSAVLLRGALWRLPLVFVGALLLGGIAGFNGFELVGGEFWIMGSLVAMGALLIVRMRIDLLWALSAVGFFGFAHGNAHGLELPLAASATTFSMGFVLASVLCHVTGIALGLLATKTRWSTSLLRIGGALLVSEGALLALTA